MNGLELEKRGSEAFQRREYDVALRLLRGAIETDSFRPSAWLWLSRTQLALEDPEAALSSIEEYLTVDPYAPRGIFQLEAVLRRQGEREQCIQLLMVLAPNHADEPDVLRTIVTRLMGLEAYAAAAEVAELLLALCPGDPEGVAARATALASQESLSKPNP